MNDAPFKITPRPANRRLPWNVSPAMARWHAVPLREKDAAIKKMDDGMTNAAWREWLRHSKHGINFRTDSECARARAIFNQEALLAKANDGAETFERFLTAKHPEMDADEVRERTLSFIALCNAASDPKIAIAALRAGTAEDTFRLDREKFEHLKAQAAKADATEKVIDSGLTQEEVRLRILQIYGRA